MPAHILLSRKVWQKIIVVTTLALPLLLAFAVPAQAVIRIEDIDEDNIFVATPELRVLIGNDEEVHGGSGNDLVVAGLDEDFIKGNRGDDVLMGGLDNDIIVGNEGNDQLFGDLGDDTLEGNEGANNFICGPGVDTITDFDPGQGDTKSPDCEIRSEYSTRYRSIMRGFSIFLVLRVFDCWCGRATPDQLTTT